MGYPTQLSSLDVASQKDGPSLPVHGRQPSHLLHVPTFPWQSILAEFGGVLYANHVRFDLRHPYNGAYTDVRISRVSFRLYTFQTTTSFAFLRISNKLTLKWLMEC